MFTREYIEHCSRHRHRIWKRVLTPGDWYVVDATGRVTLNLVDGDMVESNEEGFWVPDLDDLFWLIDRYIEAAGYDPTTTQVNLKSYSGSWLCQIILAPYMVLKEGPCSSPHETLWYCLNELSCMAQYKENEVLEADTIGE